MTLLGAIAYAVAGMLILIGLSALILLRAEGQRTKYERERLRAEGKQ